MYAIGLKAKLWLITRSNTYKQKRNKSCNAKQGRQFKTKGDVTRDDSQRRFLAKHSSATWLEWLQHCSNIATLCCAKNRRCESLRLKMTSLQ